MAALNWVNNSAFSTLSLTSAVNEMPFIPGRIGQLGIFNERGIVNTQVMIENREGELVLIPAQERGGAAYRNTRDRRKVRHLETVHLPIEDRVLPDEVQNIRAFGSESQLQGIQQEINERFLGMTRKMDATLEHLRIGAIKGQVLDADGATVLYDLFDLFGISAPAAEDFALGTDSTDVRGKCSSVIRRIEDVLGAAPYQDIWGFCGPDFFDALVSHPQVEKAYERWQQGEMLRQRTARRMFPFAGIMFEEYRGKVGDNQFIGDKECRFVPTGVDGLFENPFAPADFIEAVNTRGLPRYAKIAPDQKYNRFVDLLLQSNPLPYCTRPGVLISGTTP